MDYTPTVRTTLLSDQVAIVTGGARGIGGATASMLAANGARVVIAEIDADKAQQTADAINAEYGSDIASVFAADLAGEGACDALVQHALDTYGSLDIVVNNAGYAWDSKVHNMTDDQFQAMLDIHLIVPFRLARACAPVFRDAASRDEASGVSRNRKTVMVSSMAGSWGLAGAANYASAKAGVLGLMRTLAQEWGSYRVNVNAVTFGVIQTRFGLPQTDSETIETGGRTIHVGMPTKQAERLGLSTDPADRPSEGQMYASKFRPGIPLQRTGTIRDAADTIFWLCSPLSDYVTGQTVPVSGGARGGMS